MSQRNTDQPGRSAGNTRRSVAPLGGGLPGRRERPAAPAARRSGADPGGGPRRTVDPIPAPDFDRVVAGGQSRRQGSGTNQPAQGPSSQGTRPGQYGDGVFSGADHVLGASYAFSGHGHDVFPGSSFPDGRGGQLTVDTQGGRDRVSADSQTLTVSPRHSEVASPRNHPALQFVQEVPNSDVIWSLSTARPGNGIEQLLDGSVETFWQTDGTQPHSVIMRMPSGKQVSQIWMYLLYKSDESYTPAAISVKASVTNRLADLQDILLAEIKEPNGWVCIPLQPPVPVVKAASAGRDLAQDRDSGFPSASGIGYGNIHDRIPRSPSLRTDSTHYMETDGPALLDSAAGGTAGPGSGSPRRPVANPARFQSISASVSGSASSASLASQDRTAQVPATRTGQVPATRTGQVPVPTGQGTLERARMSIPGPAEIPSPSRRSQPVSPNRHSGASVAQGHGFRSRTLAIQYMHNDSGSLSAQSAHSSPPYQLIVLSVISNHQNGKDSHVRQIRLYEPKKPHVSDSTKILMPHELENSAYNLPVMIRNPAFRFQVR